MSDADVFIYLRKVNKEISQDLDSTLAYPDSDPARVKYLMGLKDSVKQIQAYLNAVEQEEQGQKTYPNGVTINQDVKK